MLRLSGVINFRLFCVNTIFLVLLSHNRTLLERTRVQEIWMSENSHRQIALIADDDEFFRMALSRMLTADLGFSDVVEATTFDEALEYLNANDDVDLALFDLSMPGVDSPVVLRSIREAFSVTRVAVVSGSRRKMDILQALESGMHGYIPKWLGTRELKTALEKVMEGTIYVPSSLADLDAPIAMTDDRATGMRSDGPAPTLTGRQREVLDLIIEGKSTKEIARSLDLGVGTVKVHLAGLFRTLGVANRSAAAAVGVRLQQQASSDYQPGKTQR